MNSEKIIRLLQEAASRQQDVFSDQSNPDEQLFLGDETEIDDIGCGWRKNYNLLVSMPEDSDFGFLKFDVCERDEMEVWVWPNHFDSIGEVFVQSNPIEKAYRLTQDWMAYREESPEAQGFCVVCVNLHEIAKMVLNLVQNHGAEVERLENWPPV